MNESDTVSKLETNVDKLFRIIDRYTGGTGEIPSYGDLVTDGLICWLDGSTKTNTSETKNIWNDRSLNLNHGKLSGYSYNTTSGWNNNFLVNDGVKDFIEIPVQNAYAVQFEIEINKDISDVSNSYLFDGRPNGVDVYCVLSGSISTLGNGVFEWYHDGKWVSKTTTIPRGRVVNIGITFNNPVNGNLKICKGIYEEFLKCKIKNILVYNRKLIGNEFIRNYNYLKTL
jgi:hypothetical protein